MKLLDNSQVTDASSVTSTVPETAPSAWSGGTTYAVNATASVVVASGVDQKWTGSGQIDVYRSLQASNLNHAPASSPTWWAKVGTVYQEYAGGTTYGAGDRVQVAAEHKVYESAIGSNLGNTPSANVPDKWLAVGATNRWALFDDKLGTQTKVPEEMTVSWVISGRANTLAFLNFDASTIRYRQIGPDSTVLRDQTINTVSDAGNGDWLAYFTNPIVRKTDLAIEGLALIAGCTIEVTMTAPNSTVKIGALVPGQFVTLGSTVYGAEVNFADYSQFVEDRWGNFEVNEGSYRKRGTFDVWIPKSYVDEFQRQIAKRRATLTVFQGSAEYGSTLIYGFPKLGRTAISYPDYSVSTLTLEGLAQQ